MHLQYLHRQGFEVATYDIRAGHPVPAPYVMLYRRCCRLLNALIHDVIFRLLNNASSESISLLARES